MQNIANYSMQVKILISSTTISLSLSPSYLTLYSRFEDFDFHKECAGMRYDRLTILLARVIADQDDYRYDE
jgi:hypothetical protein